VGRNTSMLYDVQQEHLAGPNLRVAAQVWLSFC